MSRKKRSKSCIAAAYQRAINGVVEYIGDRTLVLNGKTMTGKAVVAVFQRQLDLIESTADARDEWLEAVAEERATAKASSAPLLSALRYYVAAVFGIDGDDYRAFGFEPPKLPTRRKNGSKARKTKRRKQPRKVTGSSPSEPVK